MLLSVFIYNHKLTGGQWLGAGIVFAGIGVEAWVKRRGSFFVVQLQLPSGFRFFSESLAFLLESLVSSKKKADSSFNPYLHSHHHRNWHWHWRTPFLLALLWNPAADVHAKRVIKEQEKAKLKSL